jgi:peptidyl-prolyl cis-trans isomerase D
MLLAPGTTTKAPILLPDGYLLATKVEDIPARTRTVEETQEEIRQRLTRERQLAAAKAKAEAALKALPQLDPTAQLRPLSGVNRQGQLAGIGVSAALGTQLLHAEPGAWLPEIYPVGDAFVLARVRAVHPPDEAAWEAVRSQWTQSLRDQAAEQVFQAHLKELWDKARIEILIPELITPSKS